MIVFWIQHGIFQCSFLSLLGIDTLFLPHSTGERKPLFVVVCECVSVCLCVCVGMVMSEAINNSSHLVIIPLENNGHYSLTDTVHLYIRSCRKQLRNKMCICIFPTFNFHHDSALQGKLSLNQTPIANWIISLQCSISHISCSKLQ